MKIANTFESVITAGYVRKVAGSVNFERLFLVRLYGRATTAYAARRVRARKASATHRDRHEVIRCCTVRGYLAARCAPCVPGEPVPQAQGPSHPVSPQCGGPWHGRGMAEEHGTTPSDILTMVNSLPALEVYVPRVYDRGRWTGSADVVVAGMLATPVEFAAAPSRTGFTTRGTPVAYDPSRGQPFVVMPWTPPSVKHVL